MTPAGRRPRPAAAVAALLLAGSALVGCGLPMQQTAQPVPGASAPGRTVSASPTADDVPVDLWLVSDGVLVRNRAAVHGPVTAAGLVGLLADVPTSAGSQRSLVIDPVTGGPLVSVPQDVAVGSGHPLVTVQVSPSFAALPSAEQVLLLGQVVLTLTGAGAGGVVVTDPQGSPLSVPLPDGRLLEGPATRADYLPLTTPRPTPS